MEGFEVVDAQRTVEQVVLVGARERRQELHEVELRRLRRLDLLRRHRVAHEVAKQCRQGVLRQHGSRCAHFAVPAHVDQTSVR
jgi:hypothetical protein